MKKLALAILSVGLVTGSAFACSDCSCESKKCTECTECTHCHDCPNCADCSECDHDGDEVSASEDEAELDVETGEEA